MFEHFERDARLVMRACCVRGILLARIFGHQTVTYQELGEMLKTLPGGGELAHALALITDDEASRRLPLSVSIAVNSHTGTPGRGFFNQCRELGLLKEGASRVEAPQVSIEPFEIELDQDTKASLDQRKDLPHRYEGSRSQEQLSEEERDFWLQQIQALNVNIDIYWDREVQEQLGKPSYAAGSPIRTLMIAEIPADLWDREDLWGSSGGLNATFRINRKVMPAPTNQAVIPARHPREVLAASRRVRIPAYMLCVGDRVVLDKPDDRREVEVKEVRVDPLSASFLSASKRTTEEPRFVHWTDGRDNYREDLMAPLLVLTPPNILERVDEAKSLLSLGESR